MPPGLTGFGRERSDISVSSMFFFHLDFSEVWAIRNSIPFPGDGGGQTWAAKEPHLVLHVALPPSLHQLALCPPGDGALSCPSFS